MSLVGILPSDAIVRVDIRPSGCRVADYLWSRKSGLIVGPGAPRKVIRNQRWFRYSSERVSGSGTGVPDSGQRSVGDTVRFVQVHGGLQFRFGARSLLSQR
jgi:hypothetical protein